MNPADMGLVINIHLHFYHCGQASDVGAWRESVRRIRSLRPGTVHFCHHTDLVHS